MMYAEWSWIILLPERVAIRHKKMNGYETGVSFIVSIFFLFFYYWIIVKVNCLALRLTIEHLIAITWQWAAISVTIRTSWLRGWTQSSYVKFFTRVHCEDLLHLLVQLRARFRAISVYLNIVYFIDETNFLSSQLIVVIRHDTILHHNRFFLMDNCING